MTYSFLLQIIVDQKEFKEFEHRLPLTSVSHLSIDGDLYLNHVHWGGKYYPVPYESGMSLSWIIFLPVFFWIQRILLTNISFIKQRNRQKGKPHSNYKVNVTTGISAGFAVGKTLLIFGTAEKKAKRFIVNLLRRNGDIALHFNPRFDEKVRSFDRKWSKFISQ